MTHGSVWPKQDMPIHEPFHILGDPVVE
jgi:hypothetical protein